MLGVLVEKLVEKNFDCQLLLEDQPPGGSQAPKRIEGVP